MATVVFIQGGGAGAYEEDALLVRDLQERLGPGIPIDYPRMPDEGDPDPATWGPAIRGAIEAARAPVVLVGHSIGGYLLLKQLVAETPRVEVAAVALIAAPFPSGDADWTFDGFELPPDFANRLPVGTVVLLYASEDDKTVPFAHRDLYAAAIRGSRTRTTTGGHQLGNDLGQVADDILGVIGDR